MLPKKQVLASDDALWHSDVFECRVMQVNVQANPWKRVRVSIYVVDSAAYDK